MTWRYILGLLLAGSLLHFIGLSNPHQVVFDEVHFGKFVTAYCCTQERFFDIHPPHAKLLIAGVAWLGGYRGGFSFDHIGQPYEQVPILALRLLPALTGILFPLVLFILLRQLGGSNQIAFLGGMAVLLDNAMLVQTRLIALDGVLLVATFGSLSAFLAARPFGQLKVKQMVWLLLAGALAGVALGTKFTGLTALVMVGALMGVEFLRSFLNLTPNPLLGKEREYTSVKSDTSPLQGEVGLKGRVRYFWQWVLRGLLFFLAVALVYTGGWWIHWHLLTQPGSGDAWMVPTGNFLNDTIKMHQLMLSANYNLTATHHDASAWWSWPLMLTPVYYWQGAGADIYFLGNPIVWWGSALLFILALIGSLIQRNWRLWLPLLGYVISYGPLMRVPRALFLYHYLTPLLFGLIFGLLWLDRQPWFIPHRRQLITGCALTMFAGFLVISPLTYGFAIPGYQQFIFSIFPGWR